MLVLLSIWVNNIGQFTFNNAQTSAPGATIADHTTEQLDLAKRAKALNLDAIHDNVVKVTSVAK